MKLHSSRRRRLRRFMQSESQKPGKPVLRFSPNAWAKLIWFRDHGDTEVGGFGITPLPGQAATIQHTHVALDESPSLDGGLFIEDFVTVRQHTSAVTVAFEDDAVADFYDEQVDVGRQPCQFSRVWIHTHPGSSAMPSSVDEATFARVFGQSDWAVMMILARGGQTYARLRFNTGPGADLRIPVEIDYSHPFSGSDHAAWLEEFNLNIHACPERRGFPEYAGFPGQPGLDDLTGWGLPGDDRLSPRWDPAFESYLDEPSEPAGMPDTQGSPGHEGVERRLTRPRRHPTSEDPHDQERQPVR